MKGRSACVAGGFFVPHASFAPRLRCGDEPRMGNSKRDAMMSRVALRTLLGLTAFYKRSRSCPS